MLKETLEQYLELFPDERQSLSLLLEQINASEKLNDRKNFRGHVTAGGIVLSPDRQKILMVHHKTFDRWLQPGGHWDPGEENPLEAARREVTEETAVQIKEYLPVLPEQPLVPLDIETHPMPHNPKKQEKEHYHHDFRYIFIAENERVAHQAEELNSARWFSLEAPEAANLRQDLLKAKKLGIV